jgi:hypothetical protein
MKSKSKTVSNIKRGDMINVSTMTQGRYVGTTAQNVIWIAYREEDFEIMCEAFDAKLFKAEVRLSAT